MTCLQLLHFQMAPQKDPGTAGAARGSELLSKSLVFLG